MKVETVVNIVANDFIIKNRHAISRCHPFLGRRYQKEHSKPVYLQQFVPIWTCLRIFLTTHQITEYVPAMSSDDRYVDFININYIYRKR